MTNCLEGPNVGSSQVKREVISFLPDKTRDIVLAQVEQQTYHQRPQKSIIDRTS